jgi:lipid-binding SYLF domain-containing protein
MKQSSTGLLSVLFAIIISTMVFGFAIPATATEPIEQQGLVDKARVTFESFMTDKNQSWLKENLNQANGLIIIPSLLKAGFVIGGSGGSGVLIVKDDKTGQWSDNGVNRRFTPSVLEPLGFRSVPRQQKLS